MVLLKDNKWEKTDRDKLQIEPKTDHIKTQTDCRCTDIDEQQVYTQDRKQTKTQT